MSGFQAPRGMRDLFGADAAAAALSPSPSPEWKSPTRAVTETSLAVNPEPMTLSFKVRR